MAEDQPFLRKLAELHDLDFDKISARGIEATERAIVSRTESMLNRHVEAIEKQEQWKARFSKLEELTDAGAETVQEAMDAAIPEKKMGILRWLDTKSTDFLGSGLSFEEFFLHNKITDYQASFSSQIRDELRRRLRLIIKLGYEYERIAAIDQFGVASISSFIEDLIRGKFDSLREQIGWALESRFSSNSKAEKFHFVDGEKRERDRLDLWAPAITLMYEACEHLTPPQIDRQYDCVDEMLRLEGGLISYGAEPQALAAPKAIAEWERTGSMWGPMPHWYRAIIDGMFELGVRWHGPQDFEPGYWHMANGDKFPDDPAQFFGTRLYRHYGERALSDWSYRHKKKKDDADVHSRG